jgi:hypothetical protein
MFTDDQMSKIAFFASLTKISNECFKKCINFKIDEKYSENQFSYGISNILSEKEISCLKNCSINFVKLREFVDVQLFEDWEFMTRKNQKIMDDET